MSELQEAALLNVDPRGSMRAPPVGRAASVVLRGSASVMILAVAGTIVLAPWAGAALAVSRLLAAD